MKYYVWTGDIIKHIYMTQKEAELKVSKMRKENKENSVIVPTPEYRKGSILYKNGEQWAIITSVSSEVVFYREFGDKSDFDNPFLVETMPRLFKIGYLDSIEHHVKDELIKSDELRKIEDEIDNQEETIFFADDDILQVELAEETE